VNLRSTSIEWLVISASTAQFEEPGRLNGADGYAFRVIVKDFGERCARSHGFQIKIREEVDGAENDVCDNALGSDDDMDTTEIDGGSIKIHQ
jgi:hypothetical protein